MRILLFLLGSLFFILTAHAASLTNLKIDSNWKIKYNPSLWNYVYLKQTQNISSNIFENKKEKFKLMLQKEERISTVKNDPELLEKKCAEAKKIFSQYQGSSEIVTINSKKTCYIEYSSEKGKMIHQFVYPQFKSESTYDLLSYGWISSDKKTKESVKAFLKGFL